MTNDELIERLTQATGPDRELDTAIWLAVTLNSTRRKWSYTHTATGRLCEIDETREFGGRLIIVPTYTDSLDAVRSINRNALCVFASDIGADGMALVKLVTDTTTSPIVEHTGIHSRLEIAWLIATLRTLKANQEI